MNREIKYKYWYSGKMLDVGQIEFFTNGSITVNGELVGGILLQYTGLKDKNGTEIYEGDIVNMVYDDPVNRPHVIVYHENKFIAIHCGEYNYFIVGDRDIWFSNTGKLPNSFSAEVIGNIYQNPELINS